MVMSPGRTSSLGDFSPGLTLMERMAHRKRAPLGELPIEDAPNTPQRRRLLNSEDGAAVVVQKFQLVSRGAPPTKRAPVEHTVLLPPPSLTAELGERIEVCRCSECGHKAGRQRRLCRRDTESHGEYALLLSMNSSFEEECPSRSGATSLVTDACCREKSAYFILGPNSETVGYVAAVVAANRRVPGRRESLVTRDMQVPNTTPCLHQVFVMPEFRCRGLATAALAMLLRGHDTLLAEDPSSTVLKMLAKLGYTPSSTNEVEGQRVVVLARHVHEVADEE